ncbi:hypothetical protein PLANPX_5945 [Lacipirellula parvula]|uniref:Uncharacterized protein n=1 Tax=Lacipirellula parvula TaxID=2650471 RepID=A0A5K7XND3_9BACT|nr:hypothetical protein PLANPX_5945 [Lacipirellula parvula]
MWNGGSSASQPLRRRYHIPHSAFAINEAFPIRKSLRRIVDPRLPTAYPPSARESLAVGAIGAGRRTREDCGE